jgi:ATP-binding cassette subfamily B protein
VSKEKKENWLFSLLTYAAYCKIKLIVSVLFSIASIVAGLVPYLSVYRIIQTYMQDKFTMEGILPWVGLAAVAYLAKTLCFGISTMLSHISAYTILEKLRLRVIDKFLKAPLGTVTAKSIGEIKDMIVDKIESIEPPLAHMIPEVSGNLVLPIISIIILLTINWKVALASLITIPLTLIPLSILLKSNEENYGKYMQSRNAVNSAIVEYVEGIQVIKTFGQEGKSYEKFSKAILTYKKFILGWMSGTWIPAKLCIALFPSTLLGTLPIGLLLCSNGTLSPDRLCLCVMIAMSMVGSLAHLEVFMNEIKQMGFVIDESQRFLNMQSLPERQDKATIDNHVIKLSDVQFSYTGKEEILHGISLTLPQHSFTALVGPSGGGKSTIAKLIARFWDVSAGKIEIGGTDIRMIPLAQLSSLVSFVTQDNFLFRCSILENIRIGKPDATDEEVYRAAKAAQCDQFIMKLEKGYETPAGEAGNRLSGGEKQRIALARMILKNAPIIILDEATAFTDPENEDKLQLAISAISKNKTLLVIAHRLSTIKHADNIVVLEKGTIIAQGNQEELLQRCQLYKNMWKAHIGSKAWAVSQQKENNANV